MTTVPLDQEHLVTVTFEYEGHDSFSDVSQAMQAFSDVFMAYTKRNREASLRVVEFTPGSLQCHLAANHNGWLALQVMEQDVTEFVKGFRTAFMPEKARSGFVRMLKHVKAVVLKVDDAHVMKPDNSRALEVKGSNIAQRATAHSGVLDRVDLKANMFRIMMPHGHRITCTPALPFMNDISVCLKSNVPRLKVSGTGKYGHGDLLPTAIKVAKVSAVSDDRSLTEILDSLAHWQQSEELQAAFQEYDERIEAIHLNSFEE